MRNSISAELVDSLVNLNRKIINSEITHPGRLALALEEIVTDAWNEAKELSVPTWEDAEILPPSIRIDP
jgi:predicted alternative tryptophan synthase beta-subunit